MRRISETELTKKIAVTLTPTDIARLDVLAGGTNRSACVRQLIAQAWLNLNRKSEAARQKIQKEAKNDQKS